MFIFLLGSVNLCHQYFTSIALDSPFKNYVDWLALEDVLLAVLFLNSNYQVLKRLAQKALRLTKAYENCDWNSLLFDQRMSWMCTELFCKAIGRHLLHFKRVL